MAKSKVEKIDPCAYIDKSYVPHVINCQEYSPLQIGMDYSNSGCTFCSHKMGNYIDMHYMKDDGETYKSFSKYPFCDMKLATMLIEFHFPGSKKFNEKQFGCFMYRTDWTEKDRDCEKIATAYKGNTDKLVGIDFLEQSFVFNRKPCVILCKKYIGFDPKYLYKNEGCGTCNLHHGPSWPKATTPCDKQLSSCIIQYVVTYGMAAEEYATWVEYLVDNMDLEPIEKISYCAYDYRAGLVDGVNIVRSKIVDKVFEALGVGENSDGDIRVLHDWTFDKDISDLCEQRKKEKEEEDDD
jgi:hypothetical protein